MSARFSSGMAALQAARMAARRSHKPVVAFDMGALLERLLDAEVVRSAPRTGPVPLDRRVATDASEPGQMRPAVLVDVRASRCPRVRCVRLDRWVTTRGAG
jgi:hypothetical protein